MTPTLRANNNAPTSDFFAFVERILPRDKFEQFCALFRYPIKTIEVTGVCFDKLSRIFDGRNPAQNYQFLSSEDKDDWDWYRKDVLDEPNVWATRGWENFKTNFNSILVVDAKADTDRPEPYFYWLSPENVIDLELDGDKIEWIIFRQPNEKIAVIDDKDYALYESGKVLRLETIKAHGLGYCPCRFFVEESISLDDPIVKMSPITKALESLDWYLFFHTSKKHLDLFGSYPVYSGYESECGYHTENEYCEHGLLFDNNGTQLLDSLGKPLKCPVCGKKRIVGAGSFVEVPIPSDGTPDLRNPVQMLTVDRNSLDYNVAEEERLKTEIINTIVGTTDKQFTEAINERQVEANFQSQSTILNLVKKTFEGAQRFVDETICRLRYGDKFLSANISLGTEFFILSASELRERYKMAKESGASESELDALHGQIIATEYRNDPSQVQRLMMLSEIEPYRHMTRDEVVGLYERGLIPIEQMRVKLNFANLVKRFERENINILEFGLNKPYSERILTIQQQLENYANY